MTSTKNGPWFVFVLVSAIGLALAGCSSDNTTTPVTTGPEGRLYVLNQSDSTLYVYDTKDLTRVDSVHTRVPNPHYIEFSPDGLNYYITTLEATGHLAKFSTAGGFVDSVTTQPAVQPSAIAITADNLYGYVCNFSSPSARTEIHKYDLTTMTWLKQLQAGAITQNPIGIGYKCVEAAVKAMNGESLPETIDTFP